MCWRGEEENGVCVCVHVLTRGGMCCVNAFVVHLSVKKL